MLKVHSHSASAIKILEVTSLKKKETYLLNLQKTYEHEREIKADMSPTVYGEAEDSETKRGLCSF